nr:hypothetical protein [Aneurinibacillus terranovensis]
MINIKSFIKAETERKHEEIAPHIIQHPYGRFFVCLQQSCRTLAWTKRNAFESTGSLLPIRSGYICCITERSMDRPN